LSQQFDAFPPQNGTTFDIDDRESGLGSMDITNARLTYLTGEIKQNGLKLDIPKALSRINTAKSLAGAENEAKITSENNKDLLSLPQNSSTSLSNISSVSAEIAKYSTPIESPTMKPRFRLSKEIQNEHKKLNDDEESDYCDESEEDSIDCIEIQSQAIGASSNLDLTEIESRERLDSEDKSYITMKSFNIPPPPAWPPPPVPDQDVEEPHIVYPKESTVSEIKDVDELNTQDSFASIYRKEGVIPDRVPTRDSVDIEIINFPKTRDSVLMIKGNSSLN
jgi:hypothetical protein